MSRQNTLTSVLGLMLVASAAACRGDVHHVTGPDPLGAAPGHTAIPLTGDPSDYWEWMSETVPTYVELVALDQTPHSDDGVTRICPNDQLIERNANLRMAHNGEMINFYFRGPFQFIRHVSTTSPFPTALYRFSKDAPSDDGKYYAPRGNNVLLACDGHYVLDNSLIRLWVGHFYGKLYNGPILPTGGTNQIACSDGGGGGTEYGPLWPTYPVDYGPHYDQSIDNASYDPYAPDAQEFDCGSIGGGGGLGSGGNTDGEGAGCTAEYIVIEISHDGGATWSVWWEGTAEVCG
ncbi:MAG TPA: hypothetical protein VFH27_17470 [Longimicrobiaceae bacterium]|nr:hypothetical protein [Longimicrobiaceae bacterium]